MWSDFGVEGFVVVFFILGSSFLCKFRNLTSRKRNPLFQTLPRFRTSSAAKKYNVSGGAVSSYVKKYKSGQLKSSDTRTSVINLAPDDRKKTYHEIELEKEVKVLKAELGDLYLQMQMLKKAEAYKRWLKDEISSVVTVENLDQYKKDAR